MWIQVRIGLRVLPLVGSFMKGSRSFRLYHLGSSKRRPPPPQQFMRCLKLWRGWIGYLNSWEKDEYCLRTEWWDLLESPATALAYLKVSTPREKICRYIGYGLKYWIPLSKRKTTNTAQRLQKINLWVNRLPPALQGAIYHNDGDRREGKRDELRGNRNGTKSRGNLKLSDGIQTKMACMGKKKRENTAESCFQDE